MGGGWRYWGRPRRASKNKDDHDQDLRGTSPAIPSPSSCHACRGDLAGTCKVIPSPVRGPLGLKRTGRIQEARHGDEIQGRCRKKVQLKLPVKTTGKTGTLPSPGSQQKDGAWGRPREKPRGSLGNTGRPGSSGWSTTSGECGGVARFLQSRSRGLADGLFDLSNPPVTRPLVSATFVPVTPEESPGALVLPQNGRHPELKAMISLARRCSISIVEQEA